MHIFTHIVICSQTFFIFIIFCSFFWHMDTFFNNKRTLENSCASVFLIWENFQIPHLIMPKIFFFFNCNVYSIARRIYVSKRYSSSNVPVGWTYLLWLKAELLPFKCLNDSGDRLKKLQCWQIILNVWTNIFSFHLFNFFFFFHQYFFFYQ